MKKLSLILICLAMFAYTSTAFGDPPGKTVVAHCGCNFDGTDLEWVFLDVSTKSKGHQRHLDGDFESCNDESGSFVDIYERDFDDCDLIGEDGLGGVATCGTDPIEGDPCSD